MQNLMKWMLLILLQLTPTKRTYKKNLVESDSVTYSDWGKKNAASQKSLMRAFKQQKLVKVIGKIGVAHDSKHSELMDPGSGTHGQDEDESGFIDMIRPDLIVNSESKEMVIPNHLLAEGNEYWKAWKPRYPRRPRMPIRLHPSPSSL